MKKLVALLFAAALMLPVGAQAAEYGVYVAPKIGVAIQSIKIKGSLEDGSDTAKGNKAVFGGGLAIGYDFMTRFDMPLRVEAELTAWGNASKGKSYSETIFGETYTANFDGKVEVVPVFLNLYYDFHNESAFTPYVSAGIGYASVKSKMSASTNIFDFAISKTSSKGSFAWNVGLGCAYSFNDMFAVDLGYRYASYGSTKSHSGEIDGVSYHFRTQNNAQHQLMLGGRFTF